jgi:lysophospholipase L1-like esterase
MSLSISASTKILFIGDSITDCGRGEDPEQIGAGYVRVIRDSLLAADPATAPIVINRGVSGNKITDLAARWKEDVLDPAPDILSIKIGINDVWHGLSFGGGVPVEEFAPIFDDLLRQVNASLPACRFVLCEPSVIWAPAPEEGNDMLLPYIAAIRELAAKYSAQCVVPLHEAFEEARRVRPDVAWAPDGVHPSSAGHTLIAWNWLRSALPGEYR